MSKLTDMHQSHAFFAAAEKWSEKPRFYLPQGSEYTTITWQRYAGDVRDLGGFFTQYVDTQDKIAVLGNTSYEWCVTYSALQSVRGVVVPIYPASKGDLIEYFLEHSDAKALCCDASFLDTLKDLNLAGVTQILVMGESNETTCGSVPVTPFAQAIEQGKAHQEAFDHTLAGANMDDLASIIYTSGTTGLPKGVMLSHGNLQASAKDWIALNGESMPEHAIDLHWLPLSHAFGIGAIMLGNQLGWQSYFANPKNVMDKFTSVKPHVFLSVPAYWEKLYLKIQSAGGDQAAYKKVTGGNLVFGLSGGAGLKKEIKEGFYDLGLLVIEGYGLTECSPTLTMNRKDKFNFDSVGVAYPSVSVKLADDGEILAKGPNVFQGYYKNEEATKDTFTEDGWFKTGDVGQWIDGDFLKIVDRKKEILVTSGGKNVPPQNIERRFQDNPFIEHLIVYGDGKKYLTALVTLDENAIRDEVKNHTSPWSELIKSEQVLNLVDQQVGAVNTDLASFETIKKVWICPVPLTVEDNLLTASFKARRKAIYERYGAELEKLYA